jgi:hypothetical protein
MDCEVRKGRDKGWHADCKRKGTNEDNDDEEKRGKSKETMMGWTISVGTAGARGSKGTSGRLQALSVSFDAHGVTARVKVFPSADGFASDEAGSIPARQAQRVWQNVVSTLVGT